MEIRFFKNRKPLYERYVKFFHKFIKNLWIRWDTTSEGTEIIDLVNFIKTKCHENLNEICIIGDIDLVTLCKDIENILKNVKIVQFMHRSKSGQEEARFLEYCPNRTTLTLLDMTGHNLNDILQPKCNQLTHFHCMYVSLENFNKDNLRMFFQENDKIQCVVWKPIESNQNTAECIKTVINDALNLQHLFLLINEALADEEDDYHFQDICGDLKMLCDRGNFKSLEIEFDNAESARGMIKRHQNQLADFNQLTKMHLPRVHLLDMIPALKSLVHLKILVLCNAYLPTINSVHVPQIEEIQIQGRNDFSCVMAFARYWPNLKRIFIPQCPFSNTEYHLSEINRAREELENACELTIISNTVTNLEYELVKLRFGEFETCCVESNFSNCCMQSL